MVVQFVSQVRSAYFASTRKLCTNVSARVSLFISIMRSMKIQYDHLLHLTLNFCKHFHRWQIANELFFVVLNHSCVHGRLT